MQILLNVDSRQRISLGKLAKSKYYLVTKEDNGVIILTPAKVVPKNVV